MEGQLGSLQTSCEELGTQRKNSERKDKENNRLKTVISSQDENIARLQAELERSHAATMSKEHELSQALQQVAMVTEQLEHLSQERELLLRTTEMYEVEKRELQDELSQLQHRAEQDEEEKDKIKQRMTGFVSQEKEKFERLATHMKTQQRDLLAKSAQIQQVKELIRNSPHLARTPLRDTNQTITMAKTTATPPAAFAKGNAPPIKGKGRKRSASENWLEHVPSSTVENGGILQPQLKKKRTVSTPKPKDFQSKRVGRYVLQHQEEDSDGDIKTALYKGDIQPTRGGGTSVTFTGVETHRHSKPVHPVTPKITRRSNRLAVRGGNPMRPAVSSGGGQSPDHSISSLSSTSVSSFMDHSARGGGGGMEGDGEEDSWTDVETRCAIAVEGRPGSAQPALTHQTITKK
jgi:kinesin family protein 23